MADPKLEFEISGNLTVDQIFFPDGIKIGDSNTGILNQNVNAIAIGNQAGKNNQKEYSIAIGHEAGEFDQSRNSVAIGPGAGQEYQGQEAIAIGFQSGKFLQGRGSTAIGPYAGTNRVLNNEGPYAGSNDTSGIYFTAIGHGAGYERIHDNSIIINASQNGLASDASNALFVNPIRDVSMNGTRNNYRVLVYNNSTKEIGFDSSNNAVATAGGSPVIPFGSQYTVQLSNGAGNLESSNNFKFNSTSNQLQLSSSVITMSSGIRIGDASSGKIGQASSAIAIGQAAGESNQGSTAIAIGLNAGKTNQSTGIAIGLLSGNSNQGIFTIAIGFNSGYQDQKQEAIAIGSNAGYQQQNRYAIAIGNQAGYQDQSNNSIAIGQQACQEDQKVYCIGIGQEAARYRQQDYSIALGYRAGFEDQSSNSIAIGSETGRFRQQEYSVAIGYKAGFQDQSSNSIALGINSGYTDQGNDSISIGNSAGFTNQDNYAISIGLSAGRINQSEYSIAIGKDAGYTGQLQESIAIGYKAGENDQKRKAISIGYVAGRYDQSANSIAIGNNAGKENLGSHSIAIGFNAEQDNSSNNVTSHVIVLNATDISLNSTHSDAFYVKPLQDVSKNVQRSTDFKIMVYDSSSGEIAYDSSYNGITTGGGGGGGGVTPVGDLYAVQLSNGSGNLTGSNNLKFNTTSNTLNITGNLNVSQDASFNGITYLSNERNTSTLYSTNSSSPTEFTINKSVNFFDISTTSDNYYIDVSGNTTNDGQLWDIFFNTSGSTLNIDFGQDNLVVGSGLERYLTFSTLGQSASLIYIYNKWRLRNAGANVS